MGHIAECPYPRQGFAAAIEMGYDMASNSIIDKIKSDLTFFGGRRVAKAENQ